MSRFAVIYEDPDYDDYDSDEGDWEETPEIKTFDQWSPEAKKRLLDDIFSPYVTVNS